VIDITSELDAVKQDCATDNWDGYGARKVSEDSIEMANCVAKALPNYTPRPTVSADPDGQVTLEWCVTPSRTISISVGPDGTLSYAALIGDKEICGTEMFSEGYPLVTIASLLKEFLAC